MRRLCKGLLFILITCMFFVNLQVSDFNAQPSSVMATTSAGWDIYTGGIYRYGPSIIINTDNSIDVWFASPGTTSIIDLYDSLGSHVPVQLSGSNTAAQRFSAKWELRSNTG